MHVSSEIQKPHSHRAQSQVIARSLSLIQGQYVMGPELVLEQMDQVRAASQHTCICPSQHLAWLSSSGRARDTLPVAPGCPAQHWALTDAS